MTLAVIPARGGSRGLLRKNLLPIDGTPMVLRTAQAAKHAGCDVVVSTDDHQIRGLMDGAGFEVHWRNDVPEDQTADDVVRLAVPNGWEGDVLLLQPTVQPITSAIIGEFLDATQGVPMHLFVYEPHQLWINGDWATPRVNRQFIENPPQRELGIRWWPSPNRIGDPQVNYVTAQHLVDIDTAADYLSAQPSKWIEFQVLSTEPFGRGHLYRAVSIAERLQHHHITFRMEMLDEWAINFLNTRQWTIGSTLRNAVPDLIVADVLSEPIHNPNGVPVLSLEDDQHRGDVTVNALYEDGPDWCVLRPEFLHGDYQIRDQASEIMVMFGGTDPDGLGKRVHSLLSDRSLSSDWTVNWIRPGQDVSVAAAMRDADLLVTSAGRTVLEAAAVGVPTIVMSQNLREATHTHVGYEHGNLDLGLGRLVSDEAVVAAVDMVMRNRSLREELSERGRPDGRGLDRIVNVVEQMLGGIT